MFPCPSGFMSRSVSTPTTRLVPPSSSIEEGRSYPPAREISTVGGWRHGPAWMGTERNISQPAAADGCEVTNGRVLQHSSSPPVRVGLHAGGLGVVSDRSILEVA